MCPIRHLLTLYPSLACREKGTRRGNWWEGVCWSSFHRFEPRGHFLIYFFSSIQELVLNLRNHHQEINQKKKLYCIGSRLKEAEVTDQGRENKQEKKSLFLMFLIFSHCRSYQITHLSSISECIREYKSMVVQL